MTKFVRISREVIREIRREVERECGRRFVMRYSMRRHVDGNHLTANALLWKEGAELWNTLRCSDSFDEYADDANAGMVLFDFYLYDPPDGHLAANVWVLLSNDARTLAVCTSWAEAEEAVETFKPVEEKRIADYMKMVATVAKWRVKSKMNARRVPLGILADWVEDLDTQEARADAQVIRYGISLGYKG